MITALVALFVGVILGWIGAALLGGNRDAELQAARELAVRLQMELANQRALKRRKEPGT